MPYKDPQKRKEHTKNYYQNNKETIKSRVSARYQEKKEEIKECNKEYYQKNREYIIKLQKEYRTTHKDIYRQSIDKWMEEHKDEYKLWKKEWTKNYAIRNRAKIYAKDVKRRELKRASIDETTDMKKIEEFYILAKILTERFLEKYVVDHIMPIAK